MIKIKSKLIISLFIALLWLDLSGQSILAQGPVIGRPKDDPPAKPTNTSNPTNPPRKVAKPRRNPKTVSPTAVPKGKPIDFYITKGSELLDTGEFELASEYFQEADKKRKDRNATPELLELLDKQIQVAKLHIESDDSDDVEKALSNYLEILKLRPNDPKSKEEIPQLYAKLVEDALNEKDYDRAIENIDKLLSIKPGDIETKEKLIPALLGQGEAALSNGQDSVAQNSFRRVLQLDSKNLIAQEKLRLLDLKNLLEFAENKLKAEAYEDAMIKFKEALSIDPENEQAKAGLKISEGNYQKLKAEQFYRNRQYTDAEKLYQEALIILPEDEKIKSRLAEIAIRLTPPTAAKGKSIWKGTVKSTTDIKIKGLEITYSGEAEGTINSRLPEIGYTIKRVKAIAGGVTVKIADQPSANNNYTSTFSINTKKAKDVSFEIEWELKRQGQISWQGQVSGRSIVRIQGQFVDIEQVSGEQAKEVSYQGDPLPSQEATVKVRKVSGNAEIRLMEAPSQSNSYITTLEIENSSDSSTPLAFQLEWLLK